MPKERVGFRRLYDAIGCSLADREEVYIVEEFGEYNIEVYLGPKPKYGITLNKSDKYLVPSEGTQFQLNVYRDATKSSYPRSFFTEIACTKLVDVSDELSSSFHSNDQSARNQLLSMANKDSKDLITIVNFIAGLIGLRFHRQFVTEVINEDVLVMINKDDFVNQFSSPSIEILEELHLKSKEIEALNKFIQIVSQENLDEFEYGASMLVWLNHAWKGREPVSKFMALFIPLEIVLQNYSGNQEELEDNKQKAIGIRKLISTYGESQSSNLLKFFNHIYGQLRPSLTTRFYQMAEESQITGWESDVEAFRHFNKIRNNLLHRGESNIQLTISISDKEIRQLEDITERYVNWKLFGDDLVYGSRFRSKRTEDNE